MHRDVVYAFPTSILRREKKGLERGSILDINMILIKGSIQPSLMDYGTYIVIYNLKALFKAYHYRAENSNFIKGTLCNLQKKLFDWFYGWAMLLYLDNSIDAECFFVRYSDITRPLLYICSSRIRWRFPNFLKNADTDLYGPVHAHNLWMLQLGQQEDLLTDQLFHLNIIFMHG